LPGGAENGGTKQTYDGHVVGDGKWDNGYKVWVGEEGGNEELKWGGERIRKYIGGGVIVRGAGEGNEREVQRKNLGVVV